jgi:hypothetical protein
MGPTVTNNVKADQPPAIPSLGKFLEVALEAVGFRAWVGGYPQVLTSAIGRLQLKR